MSSLLSRCPLYLYVILHSFYSTMSGYRHHHSWSSRGEQIAVLELEVGVKKLICCLILKLPSRVSGPDPGRVVVNFNHGWSWSWIIVPGLSIPEGQSVRDVTVPVLTVLWEGQFLCLHACACVSEIPIATTYRAIIHHTSGVPPATHDGVSMSLHICQKYSDRERDEGLYKVEGVSVS